MRSRHRIYLSATLTLLACKFDATGLGPTTTGASDSAASTDTDPSTGAPDTTAASTTAGPGSDSASGGESETAAPPTCGDGQQDPDEQCDDGPGNGASRPCTPECTVNVCGDGFARNPGEACDDGDDDDDDACRNDCTLPPSCGNEALDRGEACDDGNDDDDDQCIACQKARCGDGFVEANNESCDDGAESMTCNLDCSLAQCGDSKLNATAGEVCDLGPQNGLYNSACSADCGGEGPRCGDGALDLPDEKCEPTVAVENATCTADCQALTCFPGRGNCDEDFANGCETDLDSDEDNCGECGEQCNVFSCKEGTCKP
jgi:hypothetical protein